MNLPRYTSPQTTVTGDFDLICDKAIYFSWYNSLFFVGYMIGESLLKEVSISDHTVTCKRLGCMYHRSLPTKKSKN